MTKAKVVARFGDPIAIAGARRDAAIVMFQSGINRFSVVYGLQVKCGLDYYNAGLEFGLCVMHYQACEGVLVNGQ